MNCISMEGLLDRLEVRVGAFAVCEIGRTAAIQCDPMDRVLVHFVLAGSGWLHCEHRRHALEKGAVVVVPRGVQKLIAGDGPIEMIVDASEHCPMEDGLIRFQAHSGNADLVLGCAWLDASIDGVSDVFQHLGEPMVENAVGPAVEPLLELMQRELANARIGSRAIIGALMKQILIQVFRNQLESQSYRSWLWPAMMNPQLAKAALAIISRPEQAHNIDNLAAMAGMSRSRFSEMFGKAFGRSPIEFLQVVRLRAARRLLSGSSLPVKSVAAAVGYSSRSHFSRAYHSYYGEAPSTSRTQQSQIG